MASVHCPICGEGYPDSDSPRSDAADMRRAQAQMEAASALAEIAGQVGQSLEPTATMLAELENAAARYVELSHPATV